MDIVAEGERHQDGQFVRHIDALDIRCGICLGKALCLGVLEDILVGESLIGHLCEDVVGRAVDDA